MNFWRGMVVVFLVGIGVLGVGCASEPFRRGALPVLVHPDPVAIRGDFAKQVVTRFISDDTVIIQAPLRDDIAVLGVLKADRAARTFELLGMNQLGVKFFHIGSVGDQTTIRFAVPPLMKQEAVLLSMGDDTRRMYFDLVPAEDAAVKVHAKVVEYRQKTGEGELVYEFGGEPVVLLEKRMMGTFGTLWRVRYYDYASAAEGGGSRPRGIVMDNHRFGYRIIVKNREWEVK